VDEDYFFFLAAGFFAAGFLAFDLVAIVLFFYGLTGLRNFSFSEGAGILLSGAAIVNGGCEIIWRVGPKLIACYCVRLVHTVRYVI
jgi:hypothetical protein